MPGEIQEGYPLLERAARKSQFKNCARLVVFSADKSITKGGNPSTDAFDCLNFDNKVKIETL